MRKYHQIDVYIYQCEPLYNRFNSLRCNADFKTGPQLLQLEVEYKHYNHLSV